MILTSIYGDEMTKISRLIYEIWEEGKITADEMTAAINILSEYKDKYMAQVEKYKHLEDPAMEGIFKQEELDESDFGCPNGPG